MNLYVKKPGVTWKFVVPRVPVINIYGACPYHGTETVITFIDHESETFGCARVVGDKPIRHLLPEEYLLQTDDSFELYNRHGQNLVSYYPGVMDEGE